MYYIRIYHNIAKTHD
jgi:hypothetical protein